MNTQEETFVCRDCIRKSKWKDRCSWCGKSDLVSESEGKELLRQEEERLEWLKTNQERIDRLKVLTLDRIYGYEIVEDIGLISGSSSKLALWGLSKQQKRLESAFDIAIFNLKSEAAMIGADAVIGVKFALNNSTGSAMNIAGSSEAVMLIGTAVKITKIDID